MKTTLTTVGPLLMAWTLLAVLAPAGQGEMMGFHFGLLFVAVPILTVAHIIMVIRGPRIFTAYCNDYQVPPSGAGWAALPPLFLWVLICVPFLLDL